MNLKPLITLEKPWFWLAFILLAIFMESVALYYQHVLDEWPCVLCIQFRIILVVLIAIAFLGMLLRTKPKVSLILAIGILITSIVMIERSYQLVGIERGFITGVCAMDLGFPSWFAIDKWLPWLFEVKTSCGYTPYIFMRISMADTLMAVSIISFSVIITVIFTACKTNQTK